jgi:hypothetical protein
VKAELAGQFPGVIAGLRSVWPVDRNPVQGFDGLVPTNPAHLFRAEADLDARRRVRQHVVAARGQKVLRIELGLRRITSSAAGLDVGAGKTGDRLLTAGEASQKARGQTEQTEHVRAPIDTSFQITRSRR